MRRFVNLRDDIGNYWRTSLADYYISPAHRLLAYAAAFILAGLLSFGTMTAYDWLNDLIRVPVKFQGIHAWNIAASFTLCLLLVDMLAALAARPWGGYDRRTVGKTWLIYLFAYLVGFAAYRTISYKLMGIYSPETIWAYGINPSQRPGIVSSFLFILPFEVVKTWVIIQMMLSMQARSEELLQVRIDAILEERARHAGACAPLSGEQAPAPEAPLQLPFDQGVGPIRPSEIGHVTVEDHYLRIYYQSDNGLQETLVRMPLKELSTLLPASRFVLIHRSHMVNLDRISRLKRTGRTVRLSMKHGEFELPVSRYRLPELLPVLDNFLNP